MNSKRFIVFFVFIVAMCMALDGKEVSGGSITSSRTKWIIGGYVGRTIPHQSIDMGHKSGSSYEAVIEYLFTSRLSVLAAGGYNTLNHQFPGLVDLKGRKRDRQENGSNFLICCFLFFVRAGNATILPSILHPIYSLADHFYIIITAERPWRDMPGKEK
jgi:hypothetical protein